MECTVVKTLYEWCSMLVSCYVRLHGQISWGGVVPCARCCSAWMRRLVTSLLCLRDAGTAQHGIVAQMVAHSCASQILAARTHTHPHRDTVWPTPCHCKSVSPAARPDCQTTHEVAAVCNSRLRLPSMPCSSQCDCCVSSVIAAANNRLCCTRHHSGFYTGMADPVPGNSGTAKCPGFPGIGKTGAGEWAP